MKQLIFSLFLTLLTLFSAGQGWEWQRNGGKDQVVIDKSGNVYNLAISNDSVVVVKKFTENGTLIWEKVLQGKTSSVLFKTDHDDNLVVAGNLTSSLVCENLQLASVGKINFFVIKFSPNSTIINSQVFGSTGETFINDIFITKSNHYVIGGGFKQTTILNGHVLLGDTFYNAFFAKLDNQFNVIWADRTTCIKAQGSPVQIEEIVETVFGSIYFTITQYCLVAIKGDTIAEYTGKYLVKLDSSRNVIWTKYLEYPGFYSTTSDLQVMQDTVYMKNYYHHHGSGHYSLYRWNPDGTESTYAFPSNNLAYNIFNGKIFFAYAFNFYSPACPYFDKRHFGILTSNFKTVKHFSDSLIFPPCGYYTHYRDLVIRNESEFYICGYGEEVATGQFVGKFRFDIVSGLEDRSRADFRIFPNPTRDIVNIDTDDNFTGTAFFHSLTGELVSRQELSPGQKKVDIGFLNTGVYVLRLVSSTRTYSRKIIKE